MLAGRTSDRVMLIFDTFMDIDRGYHPRNGFIDRMFNPRPALHAYAAMAHVLGNAARVMIDRVDQEDTLRTVRFSTGSTTHLLVSAGREPRCWLSPNAAARTTRSIYARAKSARCPKPQERPTRARNLTASGY